jgi:hypothetical protein
VSISAHHNEIGFQPPRFGNQRRAYVVVAKARVVQRGVDTVVLEMIDCILAQHGSSFGPRPVIDDDNCRFVCFVQVWQRLRQGARGFPRAIPGNEYAIEHGFGRLPVGHQKDVTARTE